MQPQRSLEPTGVGLGAGSYGSTCAMNEVRREVRLTVRFDVGYCSDLLWYDPSEHSHDDSGSKPKG
jgi:hypothetical protein